MARRHTEIMVRTMAAVRYLRRGRRRAWSYEPRLVWLERRVLLAGPPTDLAEEAVPLTVNLPFAATIAPLASAFYQISSAMGGDLTVNILAPGNAAPMSLVNAQGQPLVQSDSSGEAADDKLIDVSVPAGVE